MRYRNTVRGTISSATIMEAYQKAFGMSWWELLLSSFQGVFRFADQYYQETDEGLILEVLRQDKTDLEKYVAEDFDCDDFTFRLYGIFHMNPLTAAMPIFITWVSMPQGGHAVLSYYKAVTTTMGYVNIIEPQNDDVYFVPKEWSLMLLCG